MHTMDHVRLRVADLRAAGRRERSADDRLRRSLARQWQRRGR